MAVSNTQRATLAWLCLVASGPAAAAGAREAASAEPGSIVGPGGAVQATLSPPPPPEYGAYGPVLLCEGDLRRALCDERGGVGGRAATAAERTPHFAAAGKIQDPQDVRHMIADGEMRQPQFAGDFLVRQAGEQEIEDFLLTQGQRREGRFDAWTMISQIAVDIQPRQVDDVGAGEGRSDARNGIFALEPRYRNQDDGAVIPVEVVQGGMRRGIE